MSPRAIRNLQDVVDWDLCTGCGNCYSACKKGGITLVNVEETGIRPRFDTAACAGCSDCLSICPGYSVDARLAVGPQPLASAADHEFGPALEVWEGYAADPEIRFQASSGGLLSALSLYCLERENMAFVLHAGMDESRPWTNKTVQSRNRSEILARTGSRYGPASPCDSLRSIEESGRPCVFIGKPCDAAGAMMLRRQRPELDRKLGLVLSFFCAGTPSSRGTIDLMKSLGCDLKDVASVRYRGEGWPGRFKVSTTNGLAHKSFSYDESWGRLSNYTQFRCRLCPDGLGRVADIACGDAWEQFAKDGNPGRSIILVRTERGREILHRAKDAGYVTLEPSNAPAIFAAQANLLGRRQEIFGRLLAMRVALIPIPKFAGFTLSDAWSKLPLLHKARTVLGTLRRIALRGLWRRRRWSAQEYEFETERTKIGGRATV